MKFRQWKRKCLHVSDSSDSRTPNGTWHFCMAPKKIHIRNEKLSNSSIDEWGASTRSAKPITFEDPPRYFGKASETRKRKFSEIIPQYKCECLPPFYICVITVNKEIVGISTQKARPRTYLGNAFVSLSLRTACRSLEILLSREGSKFREIRTEPHGNPKIALGDAITRHNIV